MERIKELLIPETILFDNSLTPTDKLIYGLLSSKEPFSVKDISTITNRSERTVWRVKAKLKATDTYVSHEGINTDTCVTDTDDTDTYDSAQMCSTDTDVTPNTDTDDSTDIHVTDTYVTPTDTHDSDTDTYVSGADGGEGINTDTCVTDTYDSEQKYTEQKCSPDTDVSKRKRSHANDNFRIMQPTEVIREKTLDELLAELD